MRTELIRVYCACLLIFAPSVARAQADRYELGRHLKAIENAWEKSQPDRPAKKRAVEPLKKSVAGFFQGRFGEAARQLDQARFALSADRPSAAEEWAIAIAVRPASRLIDAPKRELSVEVAEFYKPAVAAPSDAAVRFSWTTMNGKSIGMTRELKWVGLPASIKLDFGFDEGDYWLTSEIVSGTTTLSRSSQIISRTIDGSARVSALKKQVDGVASTTLSETLRNRIRIIESLMEGKTLETDYPAVQLLKEGEKIAEAIGANNLVPWRNRPGEWWLTLAAGKRPVSVRIFAPERVADKKPMPLVIALHGAGGSENLFFEGYGAGAIVSLCKKRGWLLLAPRSDGFARSGSVADIVDEFAKLYPVDTSRVFLVGHSMGAAQALSAVGQTPDRFAGAAALGGGGIVRDAKVFERVPLFVGCGNEDFAIGMARNLSNSVRKSDKAKLEFKEYEDIEHLVIVQVALRDVFAFFDRIAEPKAP
jgi:predicted esterase